MSLRSAYFATFKGSARILLWGDRMAMQQLSDTLRKGSLSSVHIDLSDICESVDGWPISIKSVTRSFGMKPTSKGYEWGLDAQTFRDFADLAHVLATSKEPRHQFLECGAPGEIAVMVACNEYPADLRPDD
jgi:hypothetical protein